MMDVPTDYHGETGEFHDAAIVVELPGEERERNCHNEEAVRETNDNYQNSSNRSAYILETDIVNDIKIVAESIPVQESAVQNEIIGVLPVKPEEISIIPASNVGEIQVVPQDIIEPPLSKAAARMRKYRAEHRPDKSWLAKEAERMRKIRAARKAATSDS